MPARAVAPLRLEPYNAKRNFQITPEPPGKPARRRKALTYVIQKHWASHLHYDFRLELDGVLLSWAVPKGPSFDPRHKRMAVHVEDHPVDYGGFEGTIPRGQYGTGRVILWDQGTWEPVGDARAGLARGKLVFRLHGQKLAGLWELVRTSKAGEKKDLWLLFKKRDAWAQPIADHDVVTALPDSVTDKPLGLREQREHRDEKAVDLNTMHSNTWDARAARAKEKAVLPRTLAPQLATLTTDVPPGNHWICEAKFDGYRMLARITGAKVRLFTRGGHDWTAKMAPLARELGTLGVQSAWLDGEVVMPDERGVADFNALQNAFDTTRTGDLLYYLFDLPFFDGHDLRDAPLYARRDLLRQLLETRKADHLRFSPDLGTDAGALLSEACRMNLEGLLVKRRDAPYVGARTQTWLKLKCFARQEFVIIGFTDRANASAQIGALWLAYHDANGKLRHAGNVGTGFDDKTASDLYERLCRITVDTPPTEVISNERWPSRARGQHHWVRPELVAEVSFAQWTPEGRIRHASFKGLRSDKPVAAITREGPVAKTENRLKTHHIGLETDHTTRRSQRKVAYSINISHPERVVDPSTGLTKLDVIRYYEAIAPYILPHLNGRPVSLLRAPDGVAGQQFFQKHDGQLNIPGLRSLDTALWPAHEPLLEVATLQALIGAAQMNVVEFHTWNSTVRQLDKPDRMFFDLDPGEGVAWPKVREAAQLTRTLLSELGLRSWLKTSGGKGLHVVVPIAPILDYPSVKTFSQAIVQHLADTIPSRFVAKSGPRNRRGKIFVDYLRNGHSQTTVAAFSARARPGLGVSMPVSWDQLADLRSSAQWSITTAREYLSFEKQDPWSDYWTTRQRLTAAMKALASAGNLEDAIDLRSRT